MGSLASSDIWSEILRYFRISSRGDTKDDKDDKDTWLKQLMTTLEPVVRVFNVLPDYEVNGSWRAVKHLAKDEPGDVDHWSSEMCTMDVEELVLSFTEERSLITLGWVSVP
ncbi:hypothetical protein P691DRAFT_781614 [Macrolepiota fuliginosa MF-IS2]|uniref:Uncharacterized protein n=1 Tax=Macrolepiota fuliginosa MF-IS2 TaxID=1400762 RepID=A0A9P5XEV7_9AGAR|nr:hypothetical protein P691DRAFT_781614 [Macrolepiota fuliginosa MF-IS2]